MKVDVELEPFTPLLRPTYADAHAGAISEVRMEGYEFGHTYVWQGPGVGSFSSLAPPLRAGGGVDGVDGVESGLEEPRPMFLGQYSTCNFCVAIDP